MSRKIVIEGFTYVLKARFNKQPSSFNSTEFDSALEEPLQSAEFEKLPSGAQK
jgi:hypothetical protein